jgi:hypothetical protein
MTNRVLLALLMTFSFEGFSQVEENIFSESFENMFYIEPVIIDHGPENVGNPVPLDGGLTALLVAGGAVGYRRFRGRSKKN